MALTQPSHRCLQGGQTSFMMGNLRQIVAHQPEAAGKHLRVPGHDDLPGRHPPQLPEARFGRAPVMCGEHSHCRIEALVCKRQSFGHALNHRRRTFRSLADHRRRRFQRHKINTIRFVGATARPHVQHAARVSQRRMDLSGPAGLCATVHRIPRADVVIDRFDLITHNRPNYARIQYATRTGKEQGNRVKLYDYTDAPNPRRVRIFAAEKKLDLDYVQVDMRAGEHRTETFLEKNPSGKIPVLELDDGTCIAESVAICRYLEGICPEPNLFGSDALELALIETHHRRLELVLFNQIGVSWVNGPIVTKLMGNTPNEAAKKASDAVVRSFYKRLNEELGERSYMGGDRFTIADITALCAIDFASALVALKPDDSLENLWRWHATVSERPSATA